MGSGTDGDSPNLQNSNVFSQLITLLLAEKAGFSFDEKSPALQELEKFTSEMTKKLNRSAISSATPPEKT